MSNVDCHILVTRANKGTLFAQGILLKDTLGEGANGGIYEEGTEEAEDGAEEDMIEYMPASVRSPASVVLTRMDMGVRVL